MENMSMCSTGFTYTQLVHHIVVQKDPCPRPFAPAWDQDLRVQHRFLQGATASRTRQRSFFLAPVFLLEKPYDEVKGRSFCYGLAGCLGWLFGFLCLVAVSGFFTFNFWNFAVLVRLGRSCWLGCASPKPALASFACDIFACLRPTSCLIMSLDLLTPTPAAASNT